MYDIAFYFVPFAHFEIKSLFNKIVNELFDRVNK